METMQAFAKKYSVSLSEAEVKTYYRAFDQETGQGKGGIAALHFLYQLMKEPEDYYRVLTEVAEDAVATGVRYIETFGTPLIPTCHTM